MIYRRVSGILAALLAGYAAVSAPRAAAAEASYETIRDIVYAPRKDEPLRADVYRPTGQGPFPGVLCVHGGAWAVGNKNHMASIARRLAEAGYTAVSINYRLAPKHKFPAQIEDCRQALLWVRKNAKQHKIDPKRLGAWGYSAGGHLVALLAVSDTGLQAVVAGGAPCDFRKVPPDSRKYAFWLGGTRRKLPKVYESASPANFVSPDDSPIFFYHGQRDRLVRLSQPTAMAAELKKSGVAVELLAIPETGHLAAFLNRAAQSEGIKFLDKHLAVSHPE
ncbi:MAG: alpha/beta hydrolase fold domain-containing protein [Planctomycetota bacterium]|jgi:acetyl esterase/lipase